MDKIPPGYFLFQTPPFQKIGPFEFKSTLEELCCVPSGTFHLGYEDKGKLNVLIKIYIFNKEIETKVKNYLKQSLLAKAISI